MGTLFSVVHPYDRLRAVHRQILLIIYRLDFKSTPPLERCDFSGLGKHQNDDSYSTTHIIMHSSLIMGNRGRYFHLAILKMQIMQNWQVLWLGLYFSNLHVIVSTLVHDMRHEHQLLNTFTVHGLSVKTAWIWKVLNEQKSVFKLAEKTYYY